MTILSQSFENIGQSGQVPQFFYLATDNTVDEVTEDDFLDNFIKQGFPISQYNLAVVSTKTSPNSLDTSVDLYNVQKSGNKLKLALNGSGSGPNFIGTLSFGGGSNEVAFFIPGMTGTCVGSTCIRNSTNQVSITFSRSALEAFLLR